MRLFEIVDWELKVDEAVWGFMPFKELLKRDKSKDKVKSLQEMLFIYHFADARSDYNVIEDEKEKVTEIKKDIGLPEKWEPDEKVKAATDFYIKRSATVLTELYGASVDSVLAVKAYLTNTDTLLKERTDKGMPVVKVGDITKALKDVKSIMQDLKAAEREMVKEIKTAENRSKGQRTFGMFEDGL
jgi:hypothetical protein